MDCQNLNDNQIRIQKNKSLNYLNYKNIFLDFSRDESSKKLSIQNSKNKNIIIYEKDNKDIYKKNKKKNLEISKVVFEEIIDNNYNNSKKLSSQVSLQSISDSKLYQIANYYITTDESFDKFFFFNIF
jgi:ribosomal protein L5